MIQEPRSARSYIWRSAAMLGKVRGAVIVSILLGLTVSALPFVSNAAFGPVMQAVADAGIGGSLARVWDSHGSLLSRRDGAAPGPFGWLATPVPFVVLLTIWAAALLAAQLLGFIKSWIDAQVEWKLLTVIRQRVHDHIQSLSLDFFTGTRIGALMQRVQLEAAGVQRLLTVCVIPPMVDAVVLVLALAYLIALSWQMTIVALILVAVGVCGASIHRQAASGRHAADDDGAPSDGRRAGGDGQRHFRGPGLQRAAAAQRAISRGVRGGREKHCDDDDLDERGHDECAGPDRVEHRAGVDRGRRVQRELRLDFRRAWWCSSVSFRRCSPRSNESSAAYYGLQVDLSERGRDVRAARHRASRARASRVPCRWTRLHGNIVFEDVVFSYSPEQKILDGLSFSVKEGETVALVGPIGCGKSTVFNLLLRFLDPQQGRITLDGHDISHVTISTLREHVSKLAQFPFFAKDTIRENVRMARRGRDAMPRSKKPAGWRRFTPSSSTRPRSTAATTPSWTCRCRPGVRSG